jgi:hypothetical protein
VKKLKEFIWDAGAWGVASELASLVLYILGIVTVTKWGITFGTGCMLFGTIPLFWLGAFPAWNKKATELEKQKDRSTKPDITGRVLMVDTKMTGLSQGVPNCLLDIKLSVTSKTDVASTLQDAEMVVETKDGSFSATRQKVSDGSYYSPTRSSTKLEKMNDLIASTTYSNPIKYQVGLEGWLEFIFYGLDLASNAHMPVHGDVTVTPTDELGGKHIVMVKDILIRPGY